jgi:hypothetical protein
VARDHKIHLAVADMLIAVSSPLSAEELGIVDRLGPFLGTPATPRRHVAVQWREGGGTLAPQSELIYDPGSVWRMYRSGEETCALLHYQEEGARPSEPATLHANAAWDRLTLTEQPAGPGWRSLLSFGAGELILRTAILFTGGLVFHASGLDDNGNGILFAGHSGAGKSTQAALWGGERGVVVMNDDRIAVQLADGGARCYGTPWGGTAEIARQHAAPLSAIIVLEQAPENHIASLSPFAAAPLLSPRLYLPYWDVDLMRQALLNLDALIARVPIYHLRCRPGPDVIPLVRSVL